MPTFTVEAASLKKDIAPKEGMQPKKVLNLVLADSAGRHVCEWFTNATTPVPEAGSQIEGDLKDGQYGLSFTKARANGYGGGGPRPEDPKKSAAIQRMASVKAAHQSLELAVTLSVVEQPKSVEEFLKLVQRFADYWDKDVAKIKAAA